MMVRERAHQMKYECNLLVSLLPPQAADDVPTLRNRCQTVWPSLSNFLISMPFGGGMFPRWKSGISDETTTRPPPPESP